MWEYTVRGSWPFPLDMLRHDGSEPASFDDQALVTRLSAEHVTSREDFQPVEITLSGPHQPNTARWESFGWSVPTDEEYAWIKAANERDRENRRIITDVLGRLTDREREALAWHFGKGALA